MIRKLTPSFAGITGSFPQLPENPSKKGFWKYAIQSTKNLCGNSFIPVILASCSVIWIAMIVVGVVHWENCSGQKWLPKWLAIMGAAGIVKTCIKMYYHIFEEGNKLPNCLKNLENLLDIGLFILLCLGCFFAIPAYLDPRSYECDWFTVTFAFFFLLTYILISMLVASCCCLFAIWYICNTEPDDSQDDCASPL